MLELILKNLKEGRRSIEDIIYESISIEDYEERNKGYQVGDIILTKYFSTHSHTGVSPHRLLVITRVEQGDDYVQYEGLPIKTDHPDNRKSNKYSPKYPNCLSISDYRTILTPGERVPYPTKEAFIDVADKGRFRSYEISPQYSSYAGHASDEFYDFVMKGYHNYLNHEDNSNLYWEK